MGAAAGSDVGRRFLFLDFRSSGVLSGSVDFKTQPFPHQLKEFEASKDKTSWGLFHEMGLGKTKVTIDTAAHLHQDGKINGLLVLAPNGVHRNWITDEIPDHMPLASAERMRMHLWMTSKATTQKHANSARDVLHYTPPDALAVLCMSYDAIMTEAGRDFAKQFLVNRECLYVLDESPRIKTPGTARTKRVLASAVHAPFRRILTGTVVDDKPFDVYTQIKFLDRGAWGAVGCSTFDAFKATFGIWEKGFATGAGGATREYPKLVAYRNMPLLREVVAANGSRLTKESAGVQLPPKLYSKRYFELTPAQRRAYEELKQSYYTTVGESLSSADLAITRLLRFQQVTSGYLPTDDGEEGVKGLVPLCSPNPRIRLLLEVVEDAGHQVIVWAKYRADITNILIALREAGISAVRYDGECNEEEMADAVDRFKAGTAQVFVSNPAKGGEGLTLNQAKTMVYFNNTFKLGQRLQSEDRNHRIGQEVSVHVVDLVAIDTVDFEIVESLRTKRFDAAFIQGDQTKEWI